MVGNQRPHARHCRPLCQRGLLCVAPGSVSRKDYARLPGGLEADAELDTVDGMETISDKRSLEAKRTYKVQKIGITGYCMGGTFALRGACEIDELAAAAPFYGDIPEEKVLAKLKVPTIFFAGTRDTWINRREGERF